MGRPHRASATLQDGLAKLVGSRLFWAVFVFALFALPIGRTLARTLPPAPPVLGEVAPFELADQYGRVTNVEKLRGHVWVAAFLSTAGSPASPKSDAKPAPDQHMVEVLRGVVHRARNLGSAFRLVTLTTDAANDTDARRRALVEKYCSSSDLWSFLGGSPEEVQRATSALTAATGAGPADQLVLVDMRGRVRGVYTSDEAGIDHLMQDTGYVANIP